MTFMEMFHQGGFIMYPLLICSVLVWTVALHKYFNLRSFTTDYKKLGSQIHGALASNKADDVKIILQNASPILNRAHEPLLDNNFVSAETLNDRLGRRLQEVNSYLKKDLWVLGTIASSAPFIGLFGTVMGIMDSFRAIGVTGKSGFSVVASGISESLIATAAGIIVAVVAVIFYNFLQTKVNGIAQDFRHKVEDAADLLVLSKTRK
jgi:biopolymer transport protein ExbB